MRFLHSTHRLAAVPKHEHTAPTLDHVPTYKVKTVFECELRRFRTQGKSADPRCLFRRSVSEHGVKNVPAADGFVLQRRIRLREREIQEDEYEEEGVRR